MEFPDDFTNYPGTPVSTDYVLLNKYRATLAQLGLVFNTPTVLAEWNGTDVTQFGSANVFAAPVAPTLTYVASSTGPTPVLRAKLGNASPAGSGAVWWFNDAAEFQSMSIRFGLSPNATNPVQVGDGIVCGVMFAGDATAGTSISVGNIYDSTGSTFFVLSGHDGYGTTAFTETIALASSPYRINEFNFNGALRDVAGYPTLGVPSLTGVATSAGVALTAAESAVLYIDGTSGFAAGIGANATDRVGVFIVTPSGLTADTSIDITTLSVMQYNR